MRFIWLGLVFCFPFFARADLSVWDSARASEEESLFLRRIADFWQEGECEIAKSQIEEFLFTFPNAFYADPLRVCLAEFYVKEGLYEEAFSAYQQITSEALSQTVFFSRMQCLYQLGRYAALSTDCETYLETASDLEEIAQARYFLSISLYHQSLDATDVAASVQLASRAKPHCEMLLKEEDLPQEIGEAIAHFYTILQEHQKVAAIYLDLAKKDPELSEEMRFRSALAESKYDREKALKSFEDIGCGATIWAKQASYNRLVLLFEAGLYEQIVSEAKAIWKAIPEARNDEALLILGKSFFSLQKYEQAIEYLQRMQDPIPESALACLMECAYLAPDLETLGSSLTKLSKSYPESPFLLRGRIFYMELLQKSGLLQDAKKEAEAILAISGDIPEKAWALFALADLEQQMQSWDGCRKTAYHFLERYSDHELAESAWHLLIRSSESLCVAHPGDLVYVEQFAADLQKVLERAPLEKAPEERLDLQFLLAKALYQLGLVSDAWDAVPKGGLFSQEANAKLLLAFCYRDHQRDDAAFCLYAEEAIAKGADLLDPFSLHLALFNAYLHLSEDHPERIEQVADHLFSAFQTTSRGDILRENILWLGEWYFERFEKTQETLFATRSQQVFTFLKDIKLEALASDNLEDDLEAVEIALYRLGTMDASMGKVAQQIALMEQLRSLYAEEQVPSEGWRWEKEAMLLLAEGYASTEREEEAVSLLDRMIETGSANSSFAIAKAHLTRARIRAKDPALRIQAASELKNLVLQRNVANEPVHLEAALEYAILLGSEAEKRLSLLEKMQSDFEHAEDVFAQDYAEGRMQLQEKNQIYQGYMQLVDVEVLSIRSHLAKDPFEKKQFQEKANDILLKMKEEEVHLLFGTRAFALFQDLLDSGIGPCLDH